MFSIVSISHLSSFFLSLAISSPSSHHFASSTLFSPVFLIYMYTLLLSFIVDFIPFLIIHWSPYPLYVSPFLLCLPVKIIFLLAYPSVHPSLNSFPLCMCMCVDATLQGSNRSKTALYIWRTLCALATSSLCFGLLCLGLITLLCTDTQIHRHTDRNEGREACVSALHL